MELDSNHRSNLQQIYSLSPLATRESIHNGTYRARTYDPLLVRQMLSQLSYDPKILIYKLFTNKTTRMGFEPTTSAVTGRRSNQLSHRAIRRYYTFKTAYSQILNPSFLNLS